jgi:Fic family protein
MVVKSGTGRAYEQSHPWITFKLDLGRLSHMTWLRLGEVLSKCDHIAGVPLQPATADELHRIFLVKGVHATTQIEGNTLSEDEVARRVKGDLELPPSQEYLGVEVDNIIAGCNEILVALGRSEDLPLTPERVMHFNETVLTGIELDGGGQGGLVRTSSVVVGHNRGAPAEDCEYLLDRLCTWLCDLQADAPAELRLPVSILRAILAHLYIAWIHPFEDGNGRTARLIEYQLLVEAGVPTPAAHLLSNYYNRTRSRYYAVLARTSREPYPVEAFIDYAVNGFCEELREQLEVIRAQQVDVAWINYVHMHFQGSGETVRRQRDLILALPPGKFTPLSALRTLNPTLALEYQNKQQKTVSRDVNRLVELGLAIKIRAGVRPLKERMSAFLPLRRPDY